MNHDFEKSVAEIFYGNDTESKAYKKYNVKELDMDVIKKAIEKINDNYPGIITSIYQKDLEGKTLPAETATRLLAISYNNCIHLASIIDRLIKKYNLDKPDN